MPPTGVKRAKPLRVHVRHRQADLVHVRRDHDLSRSLPTGPLRRRALVHDQVAQRIGAHFVGQSAHLLANQIAHCLLVTRWAKCVRQSLDKLLHGVPLRLPRCATIELRHRCARHSCCPAASLSSRSTCGVSRRSAAM